MNYLKIFGDPKNDFMNHFIYKLSNEINYCINEMYITCKNIDDTKTTILFRFQKILEEISNWDKIIIKNETLRIKNKIPIIEDLLTCILISYTRLLCSFKTNKKIKIKIPKIEIFIHKCYILIATELWDNIYLFNDNIDKLSIQKNKKNINDIIKNNIQNTVMDFLPLKSLLKFYINNNLNNNNEIELSNELNNIINNTSPESSSEKKLYNKSLSEKNILEKNLSEKSLSEKNLSEKNLSEKNLSENKIINNTQIINQNITSIIEECSYNENKDELKEETLNIDNNILNEYDFNQNNIILDKPIKLFNK